MSQLPPLEPRTPEENLADFRKFFGDDLTQARQEARRLRSQDQPEEEPTTRSPITP